MKTRFCKKMVQRGIMTSKRRCTRPIGHRGLCTPNLLGLQFQQFRVVGVGRPYRGIDTWDCLDREGRSRPGVRAGHITSGVFQGKCAPKGRGWLTKSGYRKIKHNYKEEFEHRIVMAQILGRPLRRDEQVHHGPKGRACNDPDNLSVRLVGKHPAGHSEQELAAWLHSLGWGVTPPERVHSSD